MTKQATQKALQVLEKTSVGPVSRIQVAILSLLFEKEGRWVSQIEIGARLREERVFGKKAKVETVRIQILNALRAIEKKLGEYAIREDRLPEFQTIRVERVRGKGIILHTASGLSAKKLKYGLSAKQSQEFWLEEILSRLHLIEVSLIQLSEKMDALKSLVETRPNNERITDGSNL